MQDILLKSIFVVLFSLCACHSNEAKMDVGPEAPQSKIPVKKDVIPGAYRMDGYTPLLEEKRVGLVVNQTSMIGQRHLVDTLINRNYDIIRIFAPEHGFRGEADAGEQIKDGIDLKSGLPVISLYGKNKKPRKEDIEDLDIIVFDIQDVGVRFYTYISTLSYVMEVCAENNIPLIVLDRPNPNGFYIDGPVLNPKFSSFVGLHPIPVVYGMTIGEYAMMVNEEEWLKNKVKCSLVVIPCENYNRNDTYDLPVKPSPNLPNLKSILLYPSLCFFEGTVVSVGRGTEKPFQHIGHPDLSFKSYAFTPQSTAGAKYPKLENRTCLGNSFDHLSVDYLVQRSHIDLSYLIQYHDILKTTVPNFFLKTLFLDKLAGTDNLRKQIEEGKSEKEIRDSWKEEIDLFKTIRTKYLLYKDFD